MSRIGKQPVLIPQGVSVEVVESTVQVHGSLGALKQAFLGQLITDWIGPSGTLKKLSSQYRGMDEPGSPLICKGKVVKTYVLDHLHLVDCEIWIENSKGQQFTPGNATVLLPSQ